MFSNLIHLEHFEIDEKQRLREEASNHIKAPAAGREQGNQRHSSKIVH